MAVVERKKCAGKNNAGCCIEVAVREGSTVVLTSALFVIICFCYFWRIFQSFLISFECVIISCIFMPS